MLKRFSVENYKNFKDPLVIDFSKSHEYRFNDYCVNNGIITKALIYGKNASGKTNLGYALFSIVRVLTEKTSTQLIADPMSYINADSDKDYAKFTYVFRFNNSDVVYSYSKGPGDNLFYEELRLDNTLVYSFDFRTKQSDLSGMKLINADNLNFEYFENNIAVLRYIANNTQQNNESIVRFIMDFVSRMLFFRSVRGNEYLGFTTGVEDIEEWIINNGLVQEFQSFLYEMADINMSLGAADVTESFQGSDGVKTTRHSKRLVEQRKKYPLNFVKVASSGTFSLELLFYWSRRFKDVSLLFIDEFDAYYHFELAKNVVKYVCKFNNMQAIFTTHNSYLANNDLLRPDCYFILENGKLVSFANSTERELREGHNLEKMLRNGEFNG